VAFSPDGKTLATSTFKDRTIRLWDVAAGKEIRTCPASIEDVPSVGHSGGLARTLVFAPDGKTLVSASPGEYGRLCFWDVATGKEIRDAAGHDDEVWSVAFSPDGKTIATGGGHYTNGPGECLVHLWDSTTRRVVHTCQGCEGVVRTVVFSPDSKTLATGSGDNSIRLWDVGTGKVIRQWHQPEKWGPRPRSPYQVPCLAFSPQGDKLVSGSEDGTIYLWEPTTGKLERALGGHKNWVFAVAFSPDGKTLASGSWDRSIRLWDIRTGKEVHLIQAPAAADIVVNAEASLTFSPDGNLLAWGGFGRTIVWDLEAAKQALSLPAPGHAVVFSPDGRLLASATWHPKDSTVRLWETATGKEIRTFNGHTDSVRSLAFSPDGRTLVSGSKDTTALIWDVFALPPGRDPPRDHSAKELESLWKDLAGADAPRAYQAVGVLIAAPNQSVSFLKKQLTQSSAGPDAKVIGQLIADLDDAKFEVREKASRDLANLGPQVALALQKTLTREVSVEVRRRAEDLLAKLGERAGSPERAELRAIQVLEQVGTPEARALLQELAKRKLGNQLPEEAQSALERLARRKVIH